MNLMDEPRYLHVLQKMHQGFPLWNALNGKTLLLSGAAGMIGSILVDAVMLRNGTLPKQERCTVIAMGRSRDHAERRFPRWFAEPEFFFVPHDVRDPLPALPGAPDLLIHAASTTHPTAYASEPVNTVLSNILGTRSLLELAAGREGSRFLLLSSVEIYGENRGPKERFTEDDCGYLNCNTLRGGYPEAKRASEALCQAYRAERGVQSLVLRLPRCYGPTMKMDDSKASSQFVKNSVRGEDIVLKSLGQQRYSYAHAADAALGILWVLLRGEAGEAYNLGDPGSDVTLRELAELAAECAGTRVVFDLPDELEKKGFSTVSKALLDGGKLRRLGWSPLYDIRTGIRETVCILKETGEYSKTT